jgi:DNA adenine methylase
VKPIVKWAGGKTRLLGELRRRLPGEIGTYVEPFAGGAALFFALASEVEEGDRKLERAILCDQNRELVACYRAVQTDVESVIEALGAYRYDRDLFYETREKDTSRMSDVERAARLLFLNRTCFNGLWRVNASGRFNVPFGRYKNPRICDEEGLREASRALARAEIHHGDFSSVLSGLRAGDFVYFDPPYAPVSKTAAFTDYAAGGFDAKDQARLVSELVRLREADVLAMLSNADTPETRALYENFAMEVVFAPRAINSDAAKRGDARELLVTSWGERGVDEKQVRQRTRAERAARRA